MSTAGLTKRLELNSIADSALKGAAGSRFLVAVVGQWSFMYYIVAFYGRSTLSGNYQVWTNNTLC
jgi:hypothetical protein